MIASLTGKIIALTSDTVILEVQGIGFEIFISKSVLPTLELGQRLSLQTHLVVREDLLALYGFESSDEKQLFFQLLGVDGVGPKLALSIISNLSIDNIRRAVLNEQPEFFSRVPGVGKKTAQKILIHMQGKIVGGLEGEISHRISQVEDQVLEALVGLGYSIVEAQSAIQSIPRDTPDTVEDKLRTVLQYFDH
ncbi:MAG: Holliday junction branch migration protein RuvA [Chloroflexi bacterium]|nr:Holliday junction branch migration protein RuvA [Chloroflexota bacterium]